MDGQQPDRPVEGEELEGLDATPGSWGNYPLDDLLIRHETRTIQDVIRRIDQRRYVMDPDFQRDFIWLEDKQSKLIESVIMRIPLPVFYMAEDNEGRMVVVDGLQRLSTFQRFVGNELRLRLPDRKELNGKYFSEMPDRIQNRIEDCNLIFYIIDSKVPERARLDIFERVNGGVPLSRQQMRNCLFMGDATRFLKTEATTDIFLQATGGSLNTRTMRDREFVNRFCAFQLLDVNEYRGDMDDFLAACLEKMNQMDSSNLLELSSAFRLSLRNNFELFGQHSFRKSNPDSYRRSVLNASLWDVMSTCLSQNDEWEVDLYADALRQSVWEMIADDDFNNAITYGSNDTTKVKTRFGMARERIEEVFCDNSP